MICIRECIALYLCFTFQLKWTIYLLHGYSFTPSPKNRIRRYCVAYCFARISSSQHLFVAHSNTLHLLALVTIPCGCLLKYLPTATVFIAGICNFWFFQVLSQNYVRNVIFTVYLRLLIALCLSVYCRYLHSTMSLLTLSAKL